MADVSRRDEIVLVIPSEKIEIEIAGWKGSFNQAIAESTQPQSPLYSTNEQILKLRAKLKAAEKLYGIADAIEQRSADVLQVKQDMDILMQRCREKVLKLLRLNRH